MALNSIFGTRRALRSVLPTVAQAQVFHEVRNEDELRQALQPLELAPVNDGLPVANTGRRIVIAAPIQLKAPIIIDASLPGTLIESHGKLPITCLVEGIDAFDIRAPLVTMRGLLILGGVSADFRRCFLISAGGLVVIDDCVGVSTAGFVAAGTGIGDVGVTDCYAERAGAVVYNGVEYNGQRWRIKGSRLRGGLTGVAIRAGASGGYAAITGNALNSNGVVTTAGVGFNSIVGNVESGTLTTLGTDAVTGNT